MDEGMEERNKRKRDKTTHTVTMKTERAKKQESNGRLQRAIIGLILALIMIGSAITAMLQL